MDPHVWGNNLSFWWCRVTWWRTYSSSRVSATDSCPIYYWFHSFHCTPLPSPPPNPVDEMFTRNTSAPAVLPTSSGPQFCSSPTVNPLPGPIARPASLPEQKVRMTMVMLVLSLKHLFRARNLLLPQLVNWSISLTTIRLVSSHPPLSVLSMKPRSPRRYPMMCLAALQMLMFLVSPLCKMTTLWKMSHCITCCLLLLCLLHYLGIWLSYWWS